MNHNKDRYTISIPVTRHEILKWFNAETNKTMIYHLSLGLWVLLLTLMFTILPLTATSEYRVAFYLPLTIFIFLLYVLTHFLLQCALSNYWISQHHNSVGGSPDEEGDSVITLSVDREMNQ